MAYLKIAMAITMARSVSFGMYCGSKELANRAKLKRKLQDRKRMCEECSLESMNV